MSLVTTSLLTASRAMVPATRPSIVTSAILDTMLRHLSIHFLDTSNGDSLGARLAASRVPAACDAGTEEELRLRVAIVNCALAALEALGQVAAPNPSPNGVPRLRDLAVILRHGACKSQRKLDQLQHARRSAWVKFGLPAPRSDALIPVPSARDQATIQQAIGLIAFVNRTLQIRTGNAGIRRLALSCQPWRPGGRIGKKPKRMPRRSGRDVCVSTTIAAAIVSPHGAV